MEATAVINLWNKWGHTLAGRYVISKILSKAIPYTGSISPQIEKIENGEVVISMKDCRAVRNHLDSIHAIALANLGEFSTGLCVVTSLPPDGRAILQSINVEYLKKARGPLKAKAQFPSEKYSLTEPLVKKTIEVEGLIFDSSDNCVSKVRAHWVVGPKSQK